jgi:hypothetical protein
VAVLAGNRALGVGEPQVVREASERLTKSFKRITLPGSGGTEQILCRLAVILHSLDGGEAVMDFARFLGHDGHLRSPASAFGLEKASADLT